MNRAKLIGFSVLALLVLIVVGSCAKAPTSEMNTAAAAVAKAEGDSDTVEYAPDSLKRAKDALSRMQAESAAKKYEAAKTLALEAVQAAEKAMADGKAGKARAKEEAAGLLSSVKAALLEAESALASAKAVRGIVFDFTVAAQDMQSAQRSVATMETDLANENFKIALEKGQNARSLLGSLQNRIAEAVRAASRKK